MPKKLLRTITEKIEGDIKQFNKDNGAQARNGGIKVAKLTTDGKEAYEKAVKAGDRQKEAEILFSTELTTPTELYFKMPDLKVSDNGSIRLLSVYAYSVEANNEVLLHKLFSKVREQT
ncbi:MAG: hypothetical protein AAB656_04430 [Patescibacteria group bacterium]